MDPSDRGEVQEKELVNKVGESDGQNREALVAKLNRLHADSDTRRQNYSSDTKKLTDEIKELQKKLDDAKTRKIAADAASAAPKPAASGAVAAPVAPAPQVQVSAAPVAPTPGAVAAPRSMVQAQAGAASASKPSTIPAAQTPVQAPAGRGAGMSNIMGAYSRPPVVVMPTGPGAAAAQVPKPEEKKTPDAAASTSGGASKPGAAAERRQAEQEKKAEEERKVEELAKAKKQQEREQRLQKITAEAAEDRRREAARAAAAANVLRAPEAPAPQVQVSAAPVPALAPAPGPGAAAASMQSTASAAAQVSAVEPSAPPREEVVSVTPQTPVLAPAPVSSASVAAGRGQAAPSMQPRPVNELWWWQRGGSMPLKAVSAAFGVGKATVVGTVNLGASAVRKTSNLASRGLSMITGRGVQKVSDAVQAQAAVPEDEVRLQVQPSAPPREDVADQAALTTSATSAPADIEAQAQVSVQKYFEDKLKTIQQDIDYRRQMLVTNIATAQRNGTVPTMVYARISDDFFKNDFRQLQGSDVVKARAGEIISSSVCQVRNDFLRAVGEKERTSKQEFADMHHALLIKGTYSPEGFIEYCRGLQGCGLLYLIEPKADFKALQTAMKAQAQKDLASVTPMAAQKPTAEKGAAVAGSAPVRPNVAQANGATVAPASTAQPMPASAPTSTIPPINQQIGETPIMRAPTAPAAGGSANSSVQTPTFAAGLPTPAASVGAIPAAGGVASVGGTSTTRVNVPPSKAGGAAPILASPISTTGKGAATGRGGPANPTSIVDGGASVGGTAGTGVKPGVGTASVTGNVGQNGGKKNPAPAPKTNTGVNTGTPVDPARTNAPKTDSTKTGTNTGTPKELSFAGKTLRLHNASGKAIAASVYFTGAVVALCKYYDINIDQLTNIQDPMIQKILGFAAVAAVIASGAHWLICKEKATK